MACKKCNSERIAFVGGKSSDCSWGSVGTKEFEGYIPEDMGVGGGSYIKVEYCLNCGQIQGEFPLPETELESSNEDDDEGFCGN